MGNDNVIEFNGKRYDALTGTLLGKSHSDVAEPLAPARVVRRNIDGVVRHKRGPAHTVPGTPLPAAVSGSKTAAHHPDPVRKPARTIKPHRPQTAKTLMRRAVHKPSATLKPAIKTATPAEVMTKPMSAIALKHSVYQVDPARKHRALRTAKSRAVSHFTKDAVSTFTPQVILPSQPVQPQAVARPSLTHTKPDIFEAALARATSHEQPRHEPPARKHHKKRRLAGLTAVVATLVLAGGLLTYFNLATIELKIASLQAGFSAELPSYKPTGYKLTNIQHRPGQIVLSYRSGEHTFQLTQAPTDWNSQTLGDHIIAGAGSQPIQNKGRTIYIYDDIASWVSGGVRYDITGNTELDKDEIAAIAGSM